MGNGVVPCEFCIYETTCKTAGKPRKKPILKWRCALCALQYMRTSKDLTRPFGEMQQLFYDMWTEEAKKQLEEPDRYKEMVKMLKGERPLDDPSIMAIYPIIEAADGTIIDGYHRQERVRWTKKELREKIAPGPWGD